MYFHESHYSYQLNNTVFVHFLHGEYRSQCQLLLNMYTVLSTQTIMYFKFPIYTKKKAHIYTRKRKCDVLISNIPQNIRNIHSLSFSYDSFSYIFVFVAYQYFTLSFVYVCSSFDRWIGINWNCRGLTNVTCCACMLRVNRISVIIPPVTMSLICEAVKYCDLAAMATSQKG